MSFLTNITNLATRATGVYVDGYPKAVDNDQGSIRAGGTIDESNKFSSTAIGEGNPIDTISSGVNNQAINAAGTFNNQPSQDIMKVTTTIAGLSNNSILFGSSDSANNPSIHQKALIRSLDYKVSVVAGNWNAFSGAFDPALATTIAGGWNIIGGVEQGGTLVGDKTDKAANPSAAEPGHLAYMIGSPIPTTGLYSSKTNW
tara:strand:+ start:3102 stop:3704 length:603 start_codon:yes stop_codon:yes gene_type:complete